MKNSYNAREEEAIHAEKARELTDAELEAICGGQRADVGGLGGLGSMLPLQEILGGLTNIGGGGSGGSGGIGGLGGI